MNNSRPLISVIMPTLNVCKYIEECIESALAQTLNDIEIILVDAGSTDGTLEIVEKYVQQDSRVKLINSPVKSYGHQMNMGFEAATGEFMAILETDDVIKPDMYETLYKLAQDNNLDFIKSDYEIFVGDGSERKFTYMDCCKNPSQYNCIINPKEYLDIFNARMNTWTGLYRMSFLKENNILHNETPGASYQDNGFWFQTFIFAERIMFINKAFYQLRRDNPNSSVHNKGKVFCIFEEYEFIENIVRADKNREKTFIEMFHKKKFDNCQYHYGRVGDEFKMDFLERMSDEYKTARNNNELNSTLFYGYGFSNLNMIIDNPQKYHMYTTKKNLKKIFHIRNKVSSGLNYLGQNGLNSTLKKVFQETKKPKY